MYSDRQPDAPEAMPSIVRRMSTTAPDTVFVRTVSNESATWAQLNSSMERWAARFIALDIHRGDVVVTLLDSGLEALGIWLGLASIGAIDAATNAEFRGRMLAYAINNCRPSLLVADPKYVELIESVAAELHTVNRVLVLDGDPDNGSLKSNLPGLIRPHQIQTDVVAAREKISPPQPHDIACISYTSGTTGPSKAVLLPWGQLHSINLGTFPHEDLSSSDVFYCTTSHAHFGSKSIPYLAAMVGGSVVIRPKFALGSFWADIRRFEVSTAMLVGTMADMLERSPDSPPDGGSLKNLFMAPLGASYRTFSERFGVRICTVYNSTEGGVAIRSGWNPTNGRSVGRLRDGYPDFEVRLVDEYEREVSDGTPGECVVRARFPWVMNAGYLHNAEATATAWRQGWFHTGDALIRTPEGDYIFVDRLKDVIRRRGENISSFEVEADVLLNPHIAECAAVAVTTDLGDHEILLFAVKRPGASIGHQDLCADLESRMPRFMIPRYVEFVESLPKTQATLRIVKADLRKRGIGPDTWDRQNQTGLALLQETSQKGGGK